jgi:hypothetical protein
MWFAPPAFAADADIPVVISPADLHLRKSDPPRFPSDPTAASARCLLRVMVGTDGVPEHVDARACPERYATLAEDAVRAWRWDPPRSAGGPARAMVLVPITFTPRGRAATEPAERCTYTLEISASGVVRTTGPSVAQCVVWTPDATPHRPPPVGAACGMAVHADIARATEGWLDLSACPASAQGFAADFVGRLLFSTGTVSTRVMLMLPDPTTAPPPMAFDVSHTDQNASITRLGLESDDARAEVDPRMEMTETELPEVDLSKLFGADWKPPEDDEEKKPEEKP